MEEEAVSIISRNELRKQKLTEYLAEKRRVKKPNPRSYLYNDCQNKKTERSSQKDFKENENKGPSEKDINQIRKVTASGSQAIKPTGPKEFGFSNKINIKSNILAERQNPRWFAASSSSAKTNPELKVSRTNPTKTTAVGQIKSQPTRKKSALVDSRYRCVSNAVCQVPENSGGGRVNLGPLIKTKTGLIPAVTHTKKILSSVKVSRPTVADITNTAPCAPNMSRLKSLSSIPFSQNSTVVQRKFTTVSSVNKPVNQRVTESADTAVHGVGRLNSKPPMVYSQKLKSLDKRTIPRTTNSASLFAEKSSLHKSVPRDKKNVLQSENVQPKKDKESADTGKRQTAALRQRETWETTTDTQKIKTHIPANALKSQAGGNKIGASVMSMRVSRLGKSFCHTGPDVGTKTPKLPVRLIPKTEVKKVTAAQEERMRKLQEWREAKGISYKRPAMPVKPQVKPAAETPQPFSTAKKEEDDAYSLISAVDRSLDDCIKLLKDGCPPDKVKQVLSRLPSVSQKFAKYWICQVRLMEREDNLDVLPIFEEAVRVVLEPVDELRMVVFEILKKKDMRASEVKEKGKLQALTLPTSPENDNTVMTPKPSRVLLTGEKGASSVVKYKITATPGQKGKPGRLEGQVIRFLTPVRRSVRIERASALYPKSLQDHDVCVSSFRDLISELEGEEEKEGNVSPSISDTPLYIYRQNEALENKVSVQLVYD
ncbi:cytoskeleton-associated protein 2-like [Cynoglossus semilaevis]|uniref:Cytoskeleton associated protein 2-like n=1 Tax=Cynoglossus semilaevis TaxID=244447 RepID=A0A3P8WZ70_CYNSE|nr:cytoskeleton-associated protein 2-like [Cynoglossus semilaevis]